MSSNVDGTRSAASPESFRDVAFEAAANALSSERDALEAVSGRLDDGFIRAVKLVTACRGRTVVTGIGKSGYIAMKIAATLSSVGRPAQFLHSTEALHGDSGALTPGDVLIALSNSGRTAEVCAFARYATAIAVPVIAIVGDRTSPLAVLSEAVIDASVAREADPLNLAPTASTTAALALGDALSAATMAVAHFTPDEFHRRHPSGSLGEQLSTESGRR